MVSCFAVKNGHGGCSDHVITRSHSRWPCFGRIPAGRRLSWYPVLQSKMGMEDAQAMSSLGPTAASLVLGLFPPAGAGHGSLFCCQKWVWRLLRPCQRSVPQPLLLFWGFSRRQALVMVAYFAVKNGHGGCSGYVSARSHSRWSCFGAFPAGRRWPW